MRIRIALTTAVAVIAIPVVLFAMFSSPPAASARVTGHEATSRHGAVKIKLKLMSYAEAEKVAKTATFHSTPTARQKPTSPADLAFIKAVAVQLHQQAAVQAAAAAAAARAQAAAASAAAAAAAAVPAAAPAPAPASTTIPAAWWATAVCEEGGRDDAYAGYFGILEWHDFDGYPTAGSAPLSVQLAWEAQNVGGPPDAPGQCHSY